MTRMAKGRLGERPRLGRRRFVTGLLAVALAVPLLGASPETLPRRKAKFTYSIREVKLRVAIPELLPKSDKQAMKMLDGGYPTRLVYDIALYAKGSRTPSAAVHLEVSVQYDPWNRDYIVQSSLRGGPPTIRRYALREDAIKASTTLSVPIVRTADIPRGADEVHFVRVLAQRNPIEPKTSTTNAAARGQDRDLEVFSRWVGMFVRSRPKAEKAVEFRTHLFYVPED